MSLTIDLNMWIWDKLKGVRGQMFKFGKKGQGMHMFGAADFFIIFLGIVMGIAIMYFLRDNSFVQNLICGAVAAPAP